MVRWAWWD